MDLPTPVNKIIGTNETDEADELCSVEPLKSVVVSQLHPNTTDAKLVDFIVRKLAVNGDVIKTKALIPRDLKRDELSFISYKLMVPESLYKSILSAALWPKGIVVRDFVPSFRQRQQTGVSLN